MKFANIYKQTEENMRLALLSLWTPGNHPMRQTLTRLLQDEPLLQQPVFQSTFGWEPTHNEHWRNSLNEDVIKRLGIGSLYPPYKHQAESWKALKDGKSIVVTSGTGSGKTECFMYPVISDLYEQPRSNAIQAIFLYPLNALMEDQKKRLNDYCQPTGLKFAVYNGDTPHFRADGREDIFSNEVATRDEIRDPNGKGTRPQILLTNPSMLEYILVRKSDQKMLQESADKLRWIVIDEAHTYSGSAAVELAYQIKRILDAFGTSADKVRFACTSATIGGEDGEKPLAEFISTITGQPISQIQVIGGKRVLPELDESKLSAALAEGDLPTADRVLKLRKEINEMPGMELRQMWTALGEQGEYDAMKALELLDKLCELKIDDKAVLSLRAHFFMRTVNGLYGCANESCPGTSGTPFGHLTTKPSTVCDCCHKPMLELVQCKTCKSFLLMGKSDTQTHQLCQCEENRSLDDYFTLDQTSDDDNDDGSAVGGVSDTCFLVPNHPGETLRPVNNAYVQTLDIKHDKGKAFLKTNRDNNGKWRELRGEQDKAYCPNCGRLAQGKRLNLNHFRIPIRFVNETIAPVLLRECATAGKEWGKYIAFTDSRQGTAISAKTFNINVERTRCRENAVKLLATDDSISLRDLAEEIFDNNIFTHIQGRDNDDTAYEAALLRNFIGRRPLYESSVENMGLLTLIYPALRNVRKPTTFQDLCDAQHMVLDDVDEAWRNFLKLALDYVVRVGNHIQPLARQESSYIRDTNRSKPMAAANWPTLKTENGHVTLKQSRLILLLCAGLGIDSLAKLQQNARRIEDVLKDAWQALVDTHILTRVEARDTDGYNAPCYNNLYVDCYYLDLGRRSTKAKVKRTAEVSVCPVTQTLLDTTFCGYSPLMKGGVSPELFQRYKCTEKLTMPKRPEYDDEVEAWLQTDPAVMCMKELGFWTDRYNETYCPRQAYIAAEHSAQQSRELLRKYTQEFCKDDSTIKVLHCSTTMEMGVDIGSIDTVLMDTIPPTAANYLQRVGRAGRMGQTKALAFSLCNNTPVGENAFAHPMWALQTASHMIKVKKSQTIVQRHANSFFLRQFICDNGDGIQATMTVKEFMDDTYQPFVDFLNSMATEQAEKDKFRRVFGADVRFCMDMTILQIKELHQQYTKVVKELEDAFANYQSEPRRQIAISNQKKKYENGSLLNFLSENQFIPNANMPTGVVTFDFTDKSQATELHRLYSKLEKLKNEKEATTSSIEKMQLEVECGKVRKKVSNIQKASSASRDIRTALNEYAPEQTVVVNEKNYVSAGVILFGVYNESTDKRALYHCSTCGRTEYKQTLDEHLTCSNPKCNSPYRGIIDKRNSGYTLAYEPIGFRTDQNVEGSREERTEKHYYDILPVLLDVDWAKRTDLNLCQIAGSGDNGKLLFYNAGSGQGFAFCKRCGRAAIESLGFSSQTESLPKALRPGHNRLWGEPCDASSNDIARNVIFTGKHPTCYSVFRFLRDPASGQFENDEELAYSMGVVLTRALAKYIGVDEGEIDFGVKQEQDAWLLFIYDTAKGGCGYSLRFTAADDCQKIFNLALAEMEAADCKCEENGGACTACLVERRTYRFAEKLSKGKALDWLRRQQKNVVTPPTDLLQDNPGALVIYQSIKRIVQQAVNNSETKQMTFCVTDATADYAIQDWMSRKSEMGRLASQADANGIKVKIKVEYHPEQHQSLADKMPFIGLNGKFADYDVELVTNMGKWKTMLIVETTDGKKRYFTDNIDYLSFSNQWGADCYAVFADAKDVQFSSLPEPTYVVSPKEIIREGETSATTFPVGKYFSEAIAQSVLKPSDLDAIKEVLCGQKVDVHYSDMYVNSALASLMLTYLIDEMRTLFGFSIRDITLQLDSPRRKCYNERFSPYSKLHFNFDNQQDADEATDNLLEDVLGVKPEHSPFNAVHPRWLRLVSCKGSVEIRPDHSISGGWNTRSSYLDWERGWVDGSNVRVYRVPGEVVLYYVIIKKN